MDSLSLSKKYVQRARTWATKVGHDGCGQSLWGLSFSRGGQAAGLQPLLGLEMEIYKDGNPHNLRLLALDSQGYRNLIKISTLVMNRQVGRLNIF